MPHTYTNLLVHAVFSTKERQPTLDHEVRPRLFRYMGGVVREAGGAATTIDGVADHAHMLLSLPATVSVADVMRIVKANSSKWVHDTWPHRRAFAWQAGYGAFSVSQSNAGAVKR